MDTLIALTYLLTYLLTYQNTRRSVRGKPPCAKFQPNQFSSFGGDTVHAEQYIHTNSESRYHAGYSCTNPSQLLGLSVILPLHGRF